MGKAEGLFKALDDHNNFPLPIVISMIKISFFKRQVFAPFYGAWQGRITALTFQVMSEDGMKL